MTLRFPPAAREALRRRVAIATLLTALPLLAAPAARAADAPTTEPAAGAVLRTAPTEVAVLGVPRGGTIAVLGSDHRPVTTTPVRGAGLAAVLPALTPGFYTAVWHAPGARPATGNFAFAVDPTGKAATLVRDAAPKPELKGLGETLPKFFDFTFIMILIGTLALRFLVTARTASPVTGAIDRRLLQTAAVAAVLFIPSTLAQLVNEAATDPDRGFWGSIRPSDMWNYLTGSPDGHVYQARIVLTLFAAALLVTAALGRRRTTGAAPKIMAFALVAAVAELTLRVVPTETPDLRDAFTDVLDWGHMAAAAVWVGGLVALAVLGLTPRRSTAHEPGLWGGYLKRFSLVATVCVGVMVLTGLWTYWLHVGPPRLLVHTLYGETLLVKLGLVLALLGLGAVNQLWLLPRVQALRAAGTDGSALAVTLRHFRKVVVAEAVVGLLVLLVVPFLSGSARNQDFQAKGAGLAQAAPAGPLTVQLRRSGAEPGVTDYDITFPGAAGRAVDVAFAAPKLGVPATHVLATAIGGDRYRVSGIHTAIAGDWRATVRAGSGPAARFAFPVAAEPQDLAKADPPAIRASTWIWGAGWILVVVLALTGAGIVSRRLARRYEAHDAHGAGAHEAVAVAAR